MGIALVWRIFDVFERGQQTIEGTLRRHSNATGCCGDLRSLAEGRLEYFTPGRTLNCCQVSRPSTNWASAREGSCRGSPFEEHLDLKAAIRQGFCYGTGILTTRILLVCYEWHSWSAIYAAKSPGAGQEPRSETMSIERIYCHLQPQFTQVMPTSTTEG